MEHQDWGTPWRELPLDQDDIHALQWFAGVLGLDELSALLALVHSQQPVHLRGGFLY